MSRESQSNTFNDGMVKDLHPLLTPNTVMTDCLNGTITTYNGNEYALQNDLGNYKFEHGGLKPGFVPIGIKEYANTLYIVSYNPIDDKVEIGSFPSFKTISYSNDDEVEVKNDVDPFEDTFNFSSEYTPKIKFLTNLTDDYKLNPGDKYQLTGCNDDEIFIKNQYFILSELNQTLFDISKYIEVDNKDWSYVNWEIPG